MLFFADFPSWRIPAISQTVQRPLRLEAVRGASEGDVLGHGVAVLQQEAGDCQGNLLVFFPTDPFKTSELQNQSSDIPELLKIRRSPDLKALNCERTGRSLINFAARFNVIWIEWKFPWKWILLFVIRHYQGLKMLLPVRHIFLSRHYPCSKSLVYSEANQRMWLSVCLEKNTC